MRINFIQVNFDRANLKRANLTDANLVEISVKDADFNLAIMSDGKRYKAKTAA
ncbi:pentapeptide repeat-containing protein [Oscillatoriales cyanobacterium LEGE 11467]|uniref:Pentapeptide repeat-containing protein n=1 Tax=Zarconia navalis LEGE 11467 TaxID=1828826 RepID=A0A928Z8C7_9CYAN|nr:pentapeptide repeat-containing protein [Zarconia navalis]MBE9041455.1 pentapeptide repeat-containing protein [Zarconia navalis LEGE 11467]